MYIDSEVVSKNINLFKLGKKALIVTGKTSAVKSGALGDVTNALKENNIEYIIFNEIEQNPTLKSCIKAGNIGKTCDFVIGIGGGSPLDAAKAIAVTMANPNIDEERFYKKEWINEPKEIILVGTTAGTGSEVTKVSVLTDSKHKKHSIHDERMYAKYAFGDPRYTMSLNKDFTVSTGIDAVCHATESYFSNKANDESRKHSINCIKTMYNDLLSLKEDKELSLKARTNLYNGSIEGGYAIDITGTTFGHNVGYYLTEEYHLSHGMACALFLEDVIDYQIANNPLYALSFFKNLNMTIAEFKELLGIIPRPDIKMTGKQIEEILPRWENNGSVKNTYGTMTTGDIREILIKNFN